MGDLNMDQMERAGIPAEPSSELIAALASRRKIVARNIEVFNKNEIAPKNDVIKSTPEGNGTKWQ